METSVFRNRIVRVSLRRQLHFWDSPLGWLLENGYGSLDFNDRRPEGWTSADAAGLAILPGLVRYDEVYADAAVPEIQHAFRVTVRATKGHVYPASHTAGSTPGALPMGARLRLKASVDLTQRTSDPHMQKTFRAMQKYGLLVADNGSDMFITGTHDTRWDNDIVNPAFYTLTASAVAAAMEQAGDFRRESDRLALRSAHEARHSALHPKLRPFVCLPRATP